MNKEFTNFSLIFPDSATQIAHYEGKNKPMIDMYVLEELGMLEIFNLKNSDLNEYFTMDADVIKYRMDVFADMLACPEISQTLNKLIPIQICHIPSPKKLLKHIQRYDIHLHAY